MDQASLVLRSRLYYQCPHIFPDQIIIQTRTLLALLQLNRITKYAEPALSKKLFIYVFIRKLGSYISVRKRVLFLSK
jgi:hypothetical protein